MPKVSAGLVMYRRAAQGAEVLLVHPGGPLWAKKDVWFVPKGEVEPGEDRLGAACREFGEETGFTVSPPFLPLGTVQKSGGKVVEAWACEGDVDPAALRSNTFELEWPPRSGRRASFPEVDRARFMPLDEARQRITAAERPLIERLAGLIER